MEIRLRFKDPELEKQFYADQIVGSHSVLMMAVFVGVALYGIFSILDFFAIPETIHITWIIRFAIVIPLLLFIIWSMSRPHYKKYAQVYMGAASAIAGFGIVGMIAFTTPNEPGYILYYAGLILAIIYNYTLLRTSLKISMILGWSVVIAYEIVALGVQKLHAGGVESENFVIFLCNTFFLVSSNILGGMSGYLYEKQMRKSFLQKQVIREEKEKVERRTKALKEAQQRLLETSRQAGMAEIATGVVHNIGNVVNSVNIATSQIIRTLKNSKITTLKKANHIIRENQDNLGKFISEDEKGKRLPSLLFALEEALLQEHNSMLSETEVLDERIREIIRTVEVQSKYANGTHLVNEVNLHFLVEKALLLFQDNLTSSKIKTAVDIDKKISVQADESRLLHVLVDLFSNSRDALISIEESNRILSISASQSSSGDILLEIKDNGEGIPEEIHESIFNYGFSTRSGRNGFGLHQCANMMTEMGGKILAKSDGPGKGAEITLVFTSPEEPNSIGLTENSSPPVLQ